jgi:hypothetical protein
MRPMIGRSFALDDIAGAFRRREPGSQSEFYNAAYVVGRPDVAKQLRSLLPSGRQVTSV